MPRRLIGALASAAVLSLPGCGGDDKPKTPDQNLRSALKGQVKDADIRGGSVGVYTTLDSTDGADKAKAKGLCTKALKADKSFREVRLYDSGGVEMYYCPS